ncbi:AMP-binding protein, partial [bacterium]|nr:AMP-binding protein [bacterium]
MVDTSTPHCTPNLTVPQTLHEVLLPHIQATPDRPALLAPGASPLTYEGLGRQVTETLAACKTFGLGRQDRVALVLPNGPEMAAAFIAFCAAATCAPLNPRYREEDFEFAFTDFGVKTVVVQAGVPSPARDVARALGLPAIELHPQPEQGCGAFRLEAEPFGAAALPGPVCAQDVALALHTSGTTARPKIVPLSQANLTGAMRGVARALELTGADRCLNVMPLFHVHGLIGALLSSLCVGGSVICAPGPSAAEFFGWMDALAPTWYTAVPTIHQAILGAAPAHRKVIARRPLRFLRSCSAPLPPSVLGQLEQTFAVPVLEAYGMTEATHLMACNPLPPGPRKPGSVGLPTGTELAIMDMDQEGRLLGPNDIGEVVARGETITSGYESNPAANASSFTGGWFHTGDQGYRDEDGYYYLTGRLKELINRGGE